MRPSRTVARAALTALLALVALPGLVGSHQPSQDRPIADAAFRQVDLATARDRQGIGGPRPDSAGRSDGALAPTDALPEVARVGGPQARSQPELRRASAGSTWRTPKSTLTGTASFYDNGTTAMRLPRGTVVVICGAGGCIERVVTDYGPSRAGGRIVDLYRPDFFAICGCGWWSGTTEVTVRIY